MGPSWLHSGPTFVISRCDVHMNTGFLPLYWLVRPHRNHAQQNFGKPPERVCPGPGHLIPYYLHGSLGRSEWGGHLGEVTMESARSWESESSRRLAQLSCVCLSLGIFSCTAVPDCVSRACHAFVSVLGSGDIAVNGRDLMSLCLYF